MATLKKNNGQLSLNAGQKYCRMLQGEHSAILLTFIKLPFVIKIFVLSIFLSGRFTQVLLYNIYAFMLHCHLIMLSENYNNNKIINICLEFSHAIIKGKLYT